MKVKDVAEILEELAPLEYAEDFDNVGLLVGDQDMNVTGILVTLDSLENVIDEAISKLLLAFIRYYLRESRTLQDLII